MKDDELMNLAKEEQTKLAQDDGKKDDKESALEKDAKLKAVESAIAGKILGAYHHPWGYPLVHPLDADLAYKAGLLRGLHDSIGRYEYSRGIYPLVPPTIGAVGDVLRVLEHEGSKLPDYPWEKKEKKD